MSPQPTLEQLRTYLGSHGWEQTEAWGAELWGCPDYESDLGGLLLPPRGSVADATVYDIEGNGALEALADFEGRCQHLVLADILGTPPDQMDAAHLVAALAEARDDADILAAVGRMYLTALEEDPEGMVSYTEGIMITKVREAVVRAEARR